MTLSKKEPGLLKAWNVGEFLLFAGVGGAFGGYGRFVKGYNNLWLLAAGLPVLAWGLVQNARQPTTHINNAYRYLIAKRAATAEFEANQARIAGNSWAQSAEYASLQAALAAKGETLYDLEARLVASVEKGNFSAPAK